MKLSEPKLDSEVPTITVTADKSKNKKTVVQPIPQKLALQLANYFDINPIAPNSPVFQNAWQRNGVGMLKQDLKAAGIEYKTPEGVCDFHSLRHTFITWLAQRNTSIQLLQKAARHSSPSVTMNNYVHLEVAEKAKAMRVLPEIDFSPADVEADDSVNEPKLLGTYSGIKASKPHRNPAKFSNLSAKKRTNMPNINPCLESVYTKAGEEIRTPDVQLWKLDARFVSILDSDHYKQPPSQSTSNSTLNSAASFQSFHKFINRWASLPVNVQTAIMTLIGEDNV